jgi:hypothetical protein
MQTSFMHPPFGFALFYLRGIAPPSVKSSQIYWGAFPWVINFLVMAAIVVVWPELVSYWLDKDTGVDPSTIIIDVQPSGEAPAPDLDTPDSDTPDMETPGTDEAPGVEDSQ